MDLHQSSPALTLHRLLVLGGIRAGSEQASPTQRKLHRAGTLIASAHYCFLGQCPAAHLLKERRSHRIWVPWEGGSDGSVLGKSRDGPLATPLGCSGVSYFTRVRMCSHIHSLWMLWTLKIFVSFRDPQVCDLSWQDALVWLSSIFSPWGKGTPRSNRDSHFHHKYPLQVVCNSITLEERKKKEKEKSKTNIETKP